MQERLLRDMVLMGELSLAREYAVVNFGLDPAVLQVDPADLAADEATRSGGLVQVTCLLTHAQRIMKKT